MTVLLVDDVADIRAAISQALRFRGGFEVVAEAADGAAAVAAASEWRPDVVVLDLGLPDLAGTDVIAQLRAVAPDSQVVVYTGSVAAEHAETLPAVAAFVRKERDIGYLVDLLGDLGRLRHRSASTSLEPRLESVGEARRFVQRCCVEWGCAAAVDDAKLVATELVTNAILHAGTPCGLRMRFSGDVLRFEVGDGGVGSPDLETADVLDESGRGLLLVSAMCMAWGVDADDDGGKVVWAELSVPSDPDAEEGESARTVGNPAGDRPHRDQPGRPATEAGPRLGRWPHVERLSARMELVGVARRTELVGV